MYESLKTGILTEKELPNIKEAYARFKRLPFTHSDPDTSALASFGGRGQRQATECGQSHGRGRGAKVMVGVEEEDIFTILIVGGPSILLKNVGISLVSQSEQFRPL